MYIVININFYPGQHSASHRETHPAPPTQWSPAQNGLHPSTHRMSVLSSITPATGYFGQQEGQDSTQSSIIPLQVNSIHGAESLSSKQH